MATAAPVYDDRQMSIGRVFQRAFSTIGHNPLTVLGLAAVLGTAPSLLMNYAMRLITGNNAATMMNNSSTRWGALAFSWLVVVTIGALVQGALTRATVAEYEGHRASFGECIATAPRVVLPLIGVGLVYGLAIGIGSILLIIPGIIIMLMWAVAGPAVVIERDGVLMALRRSSELTSGSRWKIFGLFLVLLVIYVIAFALLGIVGLSYMGAAATAQSFGVAAIIGNVISATILNLLWGTIQPSLYLELREAKEGSSIENLEQVFA